jgi:hypothetical protein
VTDRGILTESPAMLAFIAQSFPQARLAPFDDPFAFAQVQAFNSYLCSTLHVAHAHRMRGHRWADDTQYRNVTATKRGRARRLHPPLRIVGQTTPVDIVLTAAIHADNGTVMVIVRQGPLSGAPYHVEDRQIGGTDQNANESAGLFTKRGDDITRFRDRSANNLTNGVTSTFHESGAANGGETIDVEHGYSPTNQQALQFGRPAFPGIGEQASSGRGPIVKPFGRVHRLLGKMLGLLHLQQVQMVEHQAAERCEPPGVIPELPSDSARGIVSQNGVGRATTAER